MNMLIFSKIFFSMSLTIDEMQGLVDVDFNGVPDQLGSRHHKKVIGSSNPNLHFIDLSIRSACLRAVFDMIV